MSGLGVVAASALVIVLGPPLAARLFDRRAPAKVVAAFHLLSLVGMGLLPLVVVACVVLVSPGHPGTGHGDLGRGLPWGAAALGTAYALRLAWYGTKAARERRRVARQAQLAAGPEDQDAGVLVLPAERPVAFSTGGRAGKVVVSRGLLDLLEGSEREAVLAHERGHRRLRHHRILFLGQVVAATLGAALPPARRAFLALRRELEAIADAEAARVVGDRRVVARALARVVLAGPARAPAPALGDPEDLAYRIERLTGTGREERGVIAGAALGLMGFGIVAAVCAAIHPSPLLPGLAACGGGVGLVVRRAVGGPRRERP